MAVSGWWQASDGHWYPPEQHPSRRGGPGAGWWQASDGQWYRPEQHPDPAHRATFADPAPPARPGPAAPHPTAPLAAASRPTAPLTAPAASGAVPPPPALAASGAVPPPPAGATGAAPVAPGQVSARPAEATADPSPASGSRRGLVLASLVLALLVVGGGAAALVLTAAGSPKAALARAVTGVDAPATTTVGFDGSFDYAALPPDEADFIEADLRFVESMLADWRAEVGLGEDRWVLDLATGELGGGLHLDIATVPAEEAVDAARARGDVPDEVAEAAEAMTSMPEEITVAFDLGMGMPPPAPAGLDGPVVALLSGEPVTVTDAGWVAVALLDAFELTTEAHDDAVEELGAAAREYYDEHVVVEEVEGVPQPVGLPAHDRVLEARLPLAEALEALAGQLPTLARLADPDGRLGAEAEAGGAQRELREQAAALAGAAEPPELVVHAWLDGRDLAGARLGFDSLLNAVAEATAATEGDLAAAEVATMAEVADDLAVEVVLDHGPLAAPRVGDAAQTHTAEAVLDDALFAEGSLIGADYATVVDMLRSGGALPPLAP